MNAKTPINTISSLSINGIQAEAVNADDFLANNKRTTEDFRAELAQALGTTGTLDIVTQMAFGTGGEIDDQGNPLPPTNNGPLNTVAITKSIKAVTYPLSTTVCFEAEILKGEITAAINEVALIDAKGHTVAKMRLLTSKGIDAESSLIFRWYVEF